MLGPQPQWVGYARRQAHGSRLAHTTVKAGPTRKAAVISGDRRPKVQCWRRHGRTHLLWFKSGELALMVLSIADGG